MTEEIKRRKKRVLNPELRNINKGMTLPIFVIEAVQEKADSQLMSFSKYVETVLIKELHLEIPKNVPPENEE
ncbi:hypothetical protein KUA55_17150 [Enterococcus sp. ALS3]|uniref:Uncharacterized protein n=1 Tax=Enterococcus alishanensis TaxID=1303817 RepID=A0ABS6THC9_9ENTE|nr:hypothetical protein [Enterococcus alishanensis]MBV7392389.1 hypothetical protein [Enterococcus alishanensis]